MNKKEEYFIKIQDIAVKNINNFTSYLKEVDLFLSTQTILKKNIIKTNEEKVKIYFIEYVKNRLEYDYKENDLDIIDLLHLKISEVCLSLKTVSTDSILTFILINMKDVINTIKIDNCDNKKELIAEYELKIKQLKEGWI